MIGLQWALGSATQYTSTGASVTMRWGIGSAQVYAAAVAAAALVFFPYHVRTQNSLIGR